MPYELLSGSDPLGPDCWYQAVPTDFGRNSLSLGSRWLAAHVVPQRQGRYTHRRTSAELPSPVCYWSELLFFSGERESWTGVAGERRKRI